MYRREIQRRADLLSRIFSQAYNENLNALINAPSPFLMTEATYFAQVERELTDLFHEEAAWLLVKTQLQRLLGPRRRRSKQR